MIMSIESDAQAVYVSDVVVHVEVSASPHILYKYHARYQWPPFLYATIPLPRVVNNPSSRRTNRN